MEEKKIYDCQRGCAKHQNPQGETVCTYNWGSCKLGVFNWLEGIAQEEYKPYFEVRFKNTRKFIFKNESGQNLKTGDIVVVEAQNGSDVGIITLEGPIVGLQLKRERIDPGTYEFRKIYRKAKPNDIEKWQNAIAREHAVMIRSRQIAADLRLNMKIGDVEFQGDGTKAIFYYIADERVDFRQLIKLFAEEFRIRIEMKQIGARQEAGLIGGLGVCGQPLCCSRYMSDFQSITTQTARSQDLSLNPQKLAGQCGKLKCCINYEAATYIDAQSRIPAINEPLRLEDGDAFLLKTDVLRGIMWFSYDPHNMANMKPLSVQEVKEILALNHRGQKAPSLLQDPAEEKAPEFLSAVGEESISRFDDSRRKNKKNGRGRERGNKLRNNRPEPEESGERNARERRKDTGRNEADREKNNGEKNGGERSFRDKSGRNSRERRKDTGRNEADRERGKKPAVENTSENQG